MDSYQAMVSVHLLISYSFSEGDSMFLDPLVFKDILHHPLSTRDIAKQDEVIMWILSTSDSKQHTRSGKLVLWGSQFSCCDYSAPCSHF